MNTSINTFIKYDLNWYFSFNLFLYLFAFV